MSEERHFDPSKIGGPFPLVAALILLTVIVVPSFVAAAGTIGEPKWAAGLFAVAAVTYPLCIIGVIWVLLTKHREKLMDDTSIIELQRDARKLAPRVDRQLNEAGVTFEALASGHFNNRSLEEIATPDADALVEVVDQLDAHGGLRAVPTEALIESARSLLAQHRWAEAARQLDQVVERDPDNWSVQFSRGVAHANSRSGAHGNMQALRAYNEAIALAPSDIEANQRARLYIYRAAVKKRLGQFDGALADLALARPLASADYEVGDLAYNEACLLAMSGRHVEAIQAVRKLIELGGIELVALHLDDYFSSLRKYDEFRDIVEIARPSPEAQETGGRLTPVSNRHNSLLARRTCVGFRAS